MGGPGIRRCRGIRGDGKGGVVGWGCWGIRGPMSPPRGPSVPSCPHGSPVPPRGGPSVPMRPPGSLMSPWEPSATSWAPQCPHGNPGVTIRAPQGPCFPVGTPTSPHVPNIPSHPWGTPPQTRPDPGDNPTPPPKDAEPPTMSPRLYWCPQKGAICQLKHKDPRQPGCCRCHPGGGRRGGHSPGRGGSGGVAEDGGTHCLQLSHQGAQRHWGGDRGGQ